MTWNWSIHNTLSMEVASSMFVTSTDAAISFRKFSYNLSVQTRWGLWTFAISGNDLDMTEFAFARRFRVAVDYVSGSSQYRLHI